MDKPLINTAGLVSTVFTVLLLLSLFVAYPLVLLNPPGLKNINHPFLVRFPVELALCSQSFFYLILHRYKFINMPKAVLLGAGLYTAAIIGSTLVKKSQPDQAMTVAGILLIPAAVAVLVHNRGIFDSLRSRIFMHTFSLLWLCCIMWSFWAKRPIGLSGNQNWFSTTLLALSPWAFFSLYHLLRSLLSRFTSGVTANIPSSLISFCCVAGLTFYWVFQSHSRGAWLALTAFVFFSILMKFSIKLRVLTVLLLAGGVLIFLKSSSFDELSRNDIREPLFKSTGRMIAESPILGWGPGQFQKTYPLFKSPEHSIRLVSAKSTEHPHNELLHIAVQIGIPAAVVWLLFFTLLLFVKVRTREGHCARFGLFVLLIHSFFDKGLISPPGSILFLIFSGILAARWCRWRIETSIHQGYMLKVAVIGAVLCLIPVSMRVAAITKGQLQYRKTAVLYSLFFKGLVKGDRKTVLKKFYDGYMEAYSYDPFKAHYPYMALHIALEKLRDPGLARAPLGAVRKIDSMYLHTNYLSALYHFMTANDSKELREQKLSLADKQMAAELALHPYDLKLREFVIDFLISAGERNRANLLFNYSNMSCLKMYKFRHGKDSSVLAGNWRESVLAGRESSITDANRILAGFKGVDSFDNQLSYLASGNSPLINLKLGEFNEVDRRYWEEILKLRDLFSKGRVGEESVKELFETLKITRKGEFSWPAEVLAQQGGSELSVACLLRIAAHSQGYLSMLVKLETLDKVHWMVYMKSENEEFLVWPSQKRILKGKLRELLTRETLDKEAGEKVRAVKFYLFEYPQAFFMKNVYLSKIVSGVLKDCPDFCSTPSLVKINLEAFLNKHWRISYLKEPFIRLEQDIKRE